MKAKLIGVVTHSLPFMIKSHLVARYAHGHVIRVGAQNHRAVAALQVHRRSVHTIVEAVYDESSSGESASETPGAGTAGSCGG